MLFAWGFLSGMAFLCGLFMCGGDVFQQLAKANIELERVKKENERLEMVLADVQHEYCGRK